jgi:uncharacterized protein (DUF58 family)
MSAGLRGGRPRRAISWLGLAAILGGLTLIRLYFDHPRLANNPNPMVAIVYLGTGCVLVVWGLRALVAEIAGVLFRRGAFSVRRYRTRMPPEASVYILILVVLCLGALLGHSNMLMLVFGLTAGPFILNGQMTLLILKRLRVTRRLPEHATAGENFSATLCLSNQKRFLSSWMVIAEDVVHNAGEQLQPAVLFTRVPPRSQCEAAYEICPARRGLYEFGPVRVMSRFPLGLMERSFELGGVEQLIVYPRIGRLTPRFRQTADSGEAVFNSARLQSGSSDDEFHRLREYRGGDNPRAIHWRTTARRNELMVREYHHNQSCDLLLVLDVWRPDRARPVDLERVELAVSFAASICVDQTRSAADSSVELVVSGREVMRASGSAGVRSIGELLRQLALAQAGPSAGLAAATRQALANSSSQVRKVLITTRSSEAARLAIQGAGGLEHNGAGANFEVFEADAMSLADFIEFDDRAPLIGRPA